VDQDRADPKAEEISAVVEAIRQRVRSRIPNGTILGEIPLPDLSALTHSRDAAEGKVASIGTVNPRPPGLMNSIAQAVKRQVARALDWHVREQVEFNRALVRCVQSTIDALNDCNRTMVALGARIEQAEQRSIQRADQIVEEHAKARREDARARLENEQANAELRSEARELKDIRQHWNEWRQHWERRLSDNEIHFLRSIAELQSSFQHRVTLMDANYREKVAAQHTDFEGALARQHDEFEHVLDRITGDVQQRFWSDLDKMRLEVDAIIHSELRVARQRAAFGRKAELVVESAPPEVASIDWLKFADRFRGSEESIRERQKIYAERFHGCRNVLDIGCGRGELLEVLKEAGVPARGIDLSEESVAICRSRGLEVEQADLFTYLSELPDSHLDGVVSCQVVEHLPPQRLPELVKLTHAKMRKGSLLAIETPNPECLAIFATHFYLDPTHQRPIPSPLLAFYMEEAGFGRILVERLSPAIESIPAVAALPDAFREQFFGGMDYVIFGWKLD
jgi:2-polyprenyl-3-methyl-5-hydroxy-6-metoxy-1,4-benzoquinol methylase